MKGGGDYVARGSYGCVYTPELKCKHQSRKIRPMKTVGKVFSDYESYKSEINVMEYVKQKVNHSDTFCVLPIEHCDIDVELTEEDCKHGKHQIVYPHGGVDLYEICKQKYHDNRTNHSQRMRIFFFMILRLENILKGLKYLSQAGVAHLDLKPSNMLYHHKKKQIKLIDFGLMHYFEDLFKGYNELFDHAYIYFAPELFMYNKYIKGYPKESILKSTKKNIKDATAFMRINFDDVMSLCGVNIDEELESFVQRVAHRDDFKHASVNKLDLYGYGITLLHIMITMRLLPLSRQESKPMITLVLEWIGMMTHVDPFKRCTVEEAIKKYKQITTFIDIGML